MSAADRPDMTRSALGAIAKMLFVMYMSEGEFTAEELAFLDEFAHVVRGAYETHRRRCGSPGSEVFPAGHHYHTLTCDRDAGHSLREQHMDKSGFRSWNDRSAIP